MIPFQRKLLQLLLPMVLSGCMSGSGVIARFNGRAEQAQRDAFLAARMAEQRGDLLRAATSYEEILKSQPQSAEVHHRMGVLCQKSGRNEEAIKHLNTAHQIEPMNIEILCDLGYSHYLQNRPKEAIETLQRAQQINPGHERTQANLAVALIAMDKVPSAVALLRQNMGEAPAATMVGFALAQRGELDEAKKYFSQALDADSTNQPAAEALLQIETMLNGSGGGGEQPGRNAAEAAVADAGQTGELPFEVISEGVASRAFSTPGNVEVIQPANTGLWQSGATDSVSITEAGVTRVSATEASVSEARDEVELPALAPQPRDSRPAFPAATSRSEGVRVEKKIRSAVIVQQGLHTEGEQPANNSAVGGLPLPPVEGSRSWRPSRRNTPQDDPATTSSKGKTGTWRSASNRSNDTVLAELDTVEPDFQREKQEITRLAGVDVEGEGEPLPVVEPVEPDGAPTVALRPVPSGTPFRIYNGAVQIAARTPAVPVMEGGVVQSGGASAGSSQGLINAGAGTAVVQRPNAEVVAAVASTTAAPMSTAPVALPAAAGVPAATAVSGGSSGSTAAQGSGGGLPLAFLRAMYGQMSDDQRVLFWNDLRKLPGSVSQTDMATYRELAKSTQNLARIEAALAMLAVFGEREVAGQLLEDSSKHSDPVVRQAAITAMSVMTIQGGGEQQR